jgi:hypothetical protein
MPSCEPTVSFENSFYVARGVPLDMSPVWRSIARAGLVELLLIIVIFTSPFVFTRPELLPYTGLLTAAYIVVVGVMGLWCWRCIRKMDEAHAKDVHERLAKMAGQKPNPSQDMDN